MKPALVQLALFLIDQGVTASELQQAIVEMFVKAAASRSRMKNGRVNQSRVAAMTGCTRTEVRRLIRPTPKYAATKEIYGARRALVGWSSDQEFTTRNGQPKRLRLRGGYGSFSSLARKYSADIPPRATLDELKRINVVRLSSGYVIQQAESEVAVRQRSQNIARATQQLLSVFKAIGYPNAVTPAVVFFGDAFLDTQGGVMDRLVKQRVEQKTKAYLGGLTSAANVFLNKSATRKPRRTGQIQVRVSITSTSQGK
jgi:hypothetical protein